MPIRELVNELIIQSKKATPHQLARLIDQAGSAPFTQDLLEVDEPLWGSFWQGDVIAPGYRLPAVELALLRATRLDTTWPEDTTVAEFLADLRQAISDPDAGVWTLAVAGEPCVVFASISGQKPVVSSQKSEATSQWSAISGRRLATVVWYCATTERLHAGYRTAIRTLRFRGAVEQRRPGESGATHPEGVNQSSWLEQVLDPYSSISGQPAAVGGPHLATHLDTEILRIRLQSLGLNFSK